MKSYFGQAPPEISSVPSILEQQTSTANAIVGTNEHCQAAKGIAKHVLPQVEHFPQWQKPAETEDWETGEFYLKNYGLGNLSHEH